MWTVLQCLRYTIQDRYIQTEDNNIGLTRILWNTFVNLSRSHSVACVDKYSHPYDLKSEVGAGIFKVPSKNYLVNIKLKNIWERINVSFTLLILTLNQILYIKKQPGIVPDIQIKIYRVIIIKLCDNWSSRILFAMYYFQYVILNENVLGLPLIYIYLIYLILAYFGQLCNKLTCILSTSVIRLYVFTSNINICIAFDTKMELSSISFILNKSQICWFLSFLWPACYLVILIFNWCSQFGMSKFEFYPHKVHVV